MNAMYEAGLILTIKIHYRFLGVKKWSKVLRLGLPAAWCAKSEC